MLIHVALVSDQTLPTLIPALMERPDKVYLAATAEMVRKGLNRRLADLLGKAGMTSVLVADAPDAELGRIHEFAHTLLERIRIEHPDADIDLNATGGTKPMMLGFVEIFRSDARHVFYTDTRHRRIEFFPAPRQPERPPLPMTDVLDVPLYLRAQGIHYGRAISDSAEQVERIMARKSAAKYLARNAAKLDPFIGALNYRANQAFGKSSTLSEPRQALDYAPHASSPWTAALRELAATHLIGWQEGEAEIVFIDEERTQFLRGGWLEEYAWHIIRDESTFDARLGVEVSTSGVSEARNEFDVIATHGNRLLFIECKTLRFNPDENDNELAYKLDSLGRASRGLFGSTWLLSAREPTPTLNQRARTLGFRIIGPTELPKLRDAVQGWMQGAD